MRHKQFSLFYMTRSLRSDLAALMLCVIVFFGLGSIKLQAQSIYIKESNGMQTAHALNKVRKMIFSSGNVMVQTTDNTTDLFSLNGLKYLSFSNYSTGIAEQQIQFGKNKLITYPNPVADVLNIDLSVASNVVGSIFILTLDGKVMQTQKVFGAGTVAIDISQLPQGIYICYYINSKEIETTKIIKQ